MKTPFAPYRRRGSALLMTMIYVMLFGALATSMVAFSVGNMQVQRADIQQNKALAAAESGMSYLLLQIQCIQKPIISEGDVGTLGSPSVLWSGVNIEPGTAPSGWANNGIAVNLASAISNCGYLSAGAVAAPTGIAPLVTPQIPVDRLNDNSTFSLNVQWGGTYTPPNSQCAVVILHLTSTGQCEGLSKAVQMDVWLQKTVRYAVFSNIAIQMGKNTVVAGDVVSTMADFSKGPPVWMISDFAHLSGQAALDTDLANFRQFLLNNDPTLSNRLNVSNNPTLKAAAATQGYYDRNGDGYIDEYDVFLNHVDTANKGYINQADYTDSNGKPLDPQLFVLLDTLNTPYQTGQATRPGLTYDSSPSMSSSLNSWLGIPDNSENYDGDGQINNNDGYAKVNGTVKVSVDGAAWNTWAQNNGSGGGAKYGVGYRAQMQGPVIPTNPTQAPVQFNYSGTDVPNLTPQNFDTSAYAAQTGTTPHSGVIASGATVSNQAIGYSNANGGTQTETSPLGAASPEATYQRPVFNNVTFNNCRISKGTNALFINCKFTGTTYVDMTTKITDPNNAGNNTNPDGSTPNGGSGGAWAQQMIGNTTFSPSTALTPTNSVGFQQGNNLRFQGCQLNGPMAAAVPSAYTHFANNWEFDGTSQFNNTVDPTATILAPNTNVDCGSFISPPTGPLPTSYLSGVVVAGNVNMRGGAWNVDGSIIVTGTGGMNTTLGYFGPNDTSTDPNAVPSGGFGRIYLRYNPTRAIPNGIKVPLAVLPQSGSYQMQ